MFYLLHETDLYTWRVLQVLDSGKHQSVRSIRITLELEFWKNWNFNILLCSKIWGVCPQSWLVSLNVNVHFTVLVNTSHTHPFAKCIPVGKMHVLIDGNLEINFIYTFYNNFTSCFVSKITHIWVCLWLSLNIKLKVFEIAFLPFDLDWIYSLLPNRECCLEKEI